MQNDTGIWATNALWRASMLLGIAAFAVYCVGFGTAHWLELDDEAFKPANDSNQVFDKHSGLWRRCFSFFNASTGEEVSGYCENVGNSKGYRVTSKIMCCVGLIAILCGLIASLTSGCFNSAFLQAVAGVTVVAGGFVAGIGSAIFLGKSMDDDSDIDAGYSAFLALFGTAGVIITGGMFLCSIHRGYNSIA